MSDYYGTPAMVKARTGISPTDLGYGTDEELTAFLVGLLGEVTDLMDRIMHKSYLTETEIPKGLGGMAADAASNSLREMIATRQTPVVRIDDFAIRVVSAKVMSSDFIDQLSRLYGKGGGVSSYDITQDDLAPLPTASPLIW